MAQMVRNGQRFEVHHNGQVVFSGSMQDAMAKVAELTKAALNAKGTTKRRRVYT